MDSILKDLRFGARALMRSHWYTAIVVLTLGLGIGANTAIFSVITGVLLRPLPYERSDRLVLLRQSAPLASVAERGCFLMNRLSSVARRAANRARSIMETI